LPLDVTLLVLLAALLHAGWNAMVKASGDRLILMAWIAASTSLIAAPLTLMVELPAREVWGYLLVTLCIHTAYMLLLVRAYAHGDFGQVYPLARGFAPLVVTLVGFAFVGETLPVYAVFGIVMIIAGIISLAWRGTGNNSGNNTNGNSNNNPNGSAGVRDLRGVGYALATGAAIAAYSIIDGLGGRTATTPFVYTIWLFLIHGVPITLITLMRRGPKLVFADKRLIAFGVGGAVMSMLAYGTVIWAMKNAPLGPVSALRETSVVFGALISGLVLKESLGPRALVAACVVAAGIILLRLY
jgi:drug/metabolite transporter (DMT)-like permease